MATTIFPTEAEFDRAAAILRSGGLVAFPTETVYGLGAHALDANAVLKIYRAKGRPATSPLIVHVDTVWMAQQLTSEWPESASLLAERFWPGPLTLILPKQSVVPAEVTGGQATVGIRVPSHPVALQLLRRAAIPVAAPSANRFTAISPTEARHVRSGLGDLVDCILDGGPTQIGIESTVLSLAEEQPMLLRPGMISVAEIEALIGPVARPRKSDPVTHSSPGLHPKHYSPKTPLMLTTKPPDGMGAYIRWSGRFRGSNASEAHTIHLAPHSASYARDLYALLHQLDHQGLDFIAVEPVPEGEEWEGIRDRLARASA